MLDDKAIEELNYYLPDRKSSMKLADFFALFADCNRLRLLSALAMKKLCVTEIANLLQVNQTTVSHQLKILRTMNVVDYTRNGKTIYYHLTDKKINEVLLLGVEYIGY